MLPKVEEKRGTVRGEKWGGAKTGDRFNFKRGVEKKGNLGK